MYDFNIKIVDENNQQVGSSTGQASAAGLALDPAKLNIPAGYQLVAGQHLTTPAKGQTVTIRVKSDGTPKPMTIHYTVKYVDASGQQVATGSGHATNAHQGDPLLGIKVPDGFTIDAGQSFTLPEDGGTVTVHVTKVGGSSDNHNNQSENPNKDKPTNPEKDNQGNQPVKPDQDKKDEGQTTDPSDNNKGHQTANLPDNKENDTQPSTDPNKDDGSDTQKQPSTDTNDHVGRHSTQPEHQETTANKSQQVGASSKSSGQNDNQPSNNSRTQSNTSQQANNDAGQSSNLTTSADPDTVVPGSTSTVNETSTSNGLLPQTGNSKATAAMSVAGMDLIAMTLAAMGVRRKIKK